MMKRSCFFVVVILTTTVVVFSQNNLPIGFIRGVPELTKEKKKQIEAIPQLKIKKTDVILPSAVDNSTNQYFRSIFNQQGNSCSQASGVGYVYTYEINFERGTSANDASRQYNYHYTWNFLNDGEDVGSWYFDGWELIMDNGVPSQADFDDNTCNEKTWMSGYDKYYRAMHNQLESYGRINSRNESGLDDIKRYLYDHADESAVGGLLVFSGKSSGYESWTIPSASVEGGKMIITSWGDGGDHAMTIVGYNDDIKYDVNGDGQYTNDVDITGEGIVNMNDWEIGALKIANSWGTGFGDNGFAYMQYRLLSLSISDGGIGNGDKYVYYMRAKDHTPLLTAKATIKYTSRNDISLNVGVSTNPESGTYQLGRKVDIFKNMGGDYYMQGGSSEAHKTIEIGIDLTPYASYIEGADNPKFFLKINRSTNGTVGSGEVVEFSVMDYRQSESNPAEYTCSQQNIPINGTVNLSVTQIPTNIFSRETENENKFIVYPNPFKENTRISFYLESSSSMLLEVLDLNGRIVHSQYYQNFNSGTNEIEWAPENNTPKGVYIIRLTNDQFVGYKKVVYN